MTGATGFIGKNLIEKLSPDEFYVMGRRNVGFANFIPFDIASDKEIVIPEDINTVIHIAGCTKTINKQDYFKVNVEWSKKLIEASVKAGVKRFILVSSQAAAGNRAVKEDDECEPVSIYGKSKLLAEKEVLKYKDKICIVIVRPPAVFGPYDSDFFKTFKMVKSGIAPIVKNSKFSYVFVKDLVYSILELTKVDVTSGEIFFVSADNPILQTDFMNIIAKIMQKNIKFVKIPEMIAFVFAFLNEIKAKIVGKADIFSIDKVREIVAGNWICDNSKIKKFIKYRETPIEVALEETYIWYKENKWL
ncbi:NAD-dependent epimerase/dehydratase family protein [Deferribacter autotrophicus]|uniref:NAD-dependent epimerase/dehydratase family protein n=1 Tax=Deferribacter autotrophicus TaxID=500465 RepID=UPI0024832DEE|nr:NAD-dependent epimerase/dehydratase family protein [Deferribacter autotrophicus]